MKIKMKKAAATPEPKSKTTKVIIRWEYTPEFARALALKQWGRGRATRKDIKKWAVALMDGCAVEVRDEEKN